MSRFIDPRPKYVHEGDTVASGKLYFWETGTTTDKTTWSDPGLTTENTNPVSLDGDGRVPEIWLQGNYRVALYTSGGLATGTKIFEVDGYEGSTASSQYGDWSNVTTYGEGDFVKASNGLYYQSLQNNNLGNEPSANAVYWVELGFITVYNANKTYSEGDVALYDGILYSSLQDANTNNTPDASPTYWQSYTGTVAASSVTYSNASSGLTATQVQAAIDEVYASTQPITKGGTGATTAADARTNLGLGDVATEDTLPVAKGGTGATTNTDARTNLGLGSIATRDVTISTSSPSGGSDGDLWFQREA